MTLGFSQKLNRKTTQFVEKITRCLDNIQVPNLRNYAADAAEKLGYTTTDEFAEAVVYAEPKLHTMREDKNDLWHAGVDIHYVINNRTSNRFQFAPVTPCISTQKVNIVYENREAGNRRVMIAIDGRMEGGASFYPSGQLATVWGITDQLAINDGFESVEDFFKYFNKTCERKLIHWTNLKY